MIWARKYISQQAVGALLLRFDLTQIRKFAGAPASALQASIDTGTQQHRIKGLGQVIVGAGLDAAPGRLGLLQPGDHDNSDRLPAARQP